jgi:Kef-type K+ transport system membrane component KefB
MHENTIVYSIFLIFTGAAVFATLSLFARQAMIVGYIILGILLGPWGLALINDTTLVTDSSQIGIIFLLYLLGLDLLPRQLMTMLGEALKVTLISSVIFAFLGYLIGMIFGYSVSESILIAACTMFSSTIIGLKLLPTTTLHHKHIGQIIISVLLIQDLIAIIILLLLQGYGKGGDLVMDIVFQLCALPVLIFVAWLIQRYILIKLIIKYDQIHEYIFLLAIAWCLGIAELANVIGLSHEIGAFVAGVSLASSPIALFITERLKPLRDFFLIIFFFSLGAGLNISLLSELIAPALLLAILIVVIKPMVFTFLLKKEGEKKHISREVGFRLGQISEFSLLIAVLAVQSQFISEATSNMIQLATLLTFIISSFIIVRSYPTPIAVRDRLRRD